MYSRQVETCTPIPGKAVWLTSFGPAAHGRMQQPLPVAPGLKEAAEAAHGLASVWRGDDLQDETLFGVVYVSTCMRKCTCVQ